MRTVDSIRILIVAAILCASSLSHAQCAVPFSLAIRDPLGNVNTGIGEDDQRWFKKISKHYPDLCYAPLKPDQGMWFYIDITTKQDTAVVTGNAVVERSSTVFTLKIGQFRNGALKVLRTFQQVHPAPETSSVRELFDQLSNKKRDVILDGMDWVEANLNEVAQP